MSTSGSSVSQNNAVAYINGKIYTVNKAQPWAEAFIVTPDGKFNAVGSTTNILRQAKAQSMAVCNLRGEFIMPGIHDAHVHTIISGSGLLDWVRLGDDANLNTIAERVHQGICACAFTHVYEDWIVGGAGFGLSDYDRSVLDQAFPDNPVVLYGGGCHNWYTNTVALQRAGYDLKGEPDLPGGVHDRRPDGSLTGLLKDQAGNRMVAAIPKPSLAHVKRVVRRAIVEMHRCGVTSCQDASTSQALLSALQELEAEGALKMQFATHVLYKNPWLSGEVQIPPDRLILDAESYRSKHVDTRFVKMMMDGGCTPDLMSHSDVDQHGKADKSQILLPDAQELVEKFDARGLTCKIHCMGYGGATTALDAFEAVRRKSPDGPRHEIAHCTQILRDDFPRFRKLNVTAEMSPADIFDKAGHEYFHMFNYDFERMAAAKSHITIGSDWANGMTLPLLPSVAGVAKALGAEKVLEIITLAGAIAVRREKEAGSIEVGKTASFISVDRDLTQGGFSDAKVLKTWFEGEIVYDSSGALL